MNLLVRYGLLLLIVISCSKDEIILPTVKTNDATNVAYNSAKVSADLIEPGTFYITGLVLPGIQLPTSTWNLKLLHWILVIYRQFTKKPCAILIQGLNITLPLSSTQVIKLYGQRRKPLQHA